MKKLFLVMILMPGMVQAACRWVWVDHDFNLSTPAIQKQVCDSTIDIPAIRPPTIRPIQQPRIRPIEIPTIPPIGTNRCRTQNVYNENARRWELKRICN